MTLRRDAAPSNYQVRRAVSVAAACAFASLALGGGPASAMSLSAAFGPVGSGQAAPAGLELQQEPSEAYVLANVWETDPQALPPNAFLEPRGVAVDAFDGAVFVVDGGNRRVQVFEPDGTFIRTIGGPSRQPDGLGDPRDVAVQGSQLFVTDYTRDRVAVFRLDGTYLDEWTDLDGPWGITAAPDGRVFVVENDASRVSVFRADGRLLSQWGGFGGGADRLNRPTGVDVAPDGRLFVADAGNGRLVVYDAAGIMLRESSRSDPGSEPWDLAIDTAGSVFVVRSDSLVERRLDRPELPTDGRTWTLPGGYGIAAAADSSVYATFQDDERPMHGVHRWTGRPITDAGQWGGVPAPLGRFDGPFRIASGLRTLVADTWRRVQELDASGTALGQTPVGQVNDLAPGPNGDVFVARDSELARLGSDGITTWRWAVPAGDGYSWAVSLDYDPEADRLTAIDLGGQRVHVLSGSGEPIDDWSFRAGFGPGALVPLWDLGSSSDAYFTLNRGADAVERRDPATGAVLAAWQVPGGPIRLATDATGYVFVLSRSGWAWKYAPTGDLMSVWPVGSAADPSSRPTDIAVDMLGRVLIVDQGLDRVEVYVHDPDAEPHGVPSFDPSCSAIGDKTADPTFLSLGDETTIELVIGGNCPTVTTTADVVLVIDHSGSMSGPKLEAAKSAATAFLDATDFGQAQVGLVGFNQAALVIQELTANKIAVARGVESLVAGGGTDIADGVDKARTELGGPRARSSAAPVVVLLTDGHNNAQREPAQRAADQAKLEGARVFTIGYGDGADVVLLESMATAPADYYFAPGPDDLEDIYRQIATRIAADVLFATLMVTDILPDNMLFVVGSGQPEPTVNGRVLVWQLADVPFGGFTLQYRVRPLEIGTWPTNVIASGEGTDGLGKRGRVEFPVPEVVVVAPSATPTGTRPPTATPTPSPTATVRPSPIYLPIVHNECVRRQNADVVLVVDTSDSMLGATRTGRTKLEAATDAAGSFVELLDLSSDAAAVVAFNRDAEVMQRLTRDELALRSALNRLPQAPGTRIDLGLAAAAGVLTGNGRHTSNLPVVVLLTDGRPTLSTPDDVLSEAERLKATGARVYVIGLGPDVDAALLAQVAGDTRRLILTPDAEDLERVYSEIARDLPCLRP